MQLYKQEFCRFQLAIDFTVQLMIYQNYQLPQSRVLRQKFKRFCYAEKIRQIITKISVKNQQ
ncbi:unnamed protein product [Paramecium octaurelia]|uniref:Uncharacterized protein n=1 Tax=Paramecium octaurelia TaxID=43137 RepID=A0A8S1YIP4_PAROT|nr:unnamed protein product [Paramecium octaurelia]